MATSKKNNFLYSDGMVPVYIILLAVLTIGSCSRNETAEQYAMFDYNIVTEVQNTKTFVDSLVIHTHPDPVRYIEETMNDTKKNNLRGSFVKFTALAYYHAEYMKDYQTASANTDRTLALFEQTDISHVENKLYYLNAVLQKSDLLRHQGFYGTSVQQLLAAQQLTDPALSPCITYQYSGRLGTFSYEQANYWKSIYYYSQAWEIATRCNTEKNEQYYVRKYQYLQNIASNYARLNMPYSALYYHDQSLAALDVIAARPVISENMAHFIILGRAVAYGNKADELQKTGQGDIAEMFWKESIEINMDPGFASEHAQHKKLHMTEYYISEKRMDEAEQILYEVEEWNRNTQSDTITRNWHYLYWKWLAETGTTEQAYRAYRTYIEITEKEENARFELIATDLDMQAGFQSKNLQIRQMESKQAAQNVYLGFLFPLSIFILISLAIVWRNRVATRKSLAQIDETNKDYEQKNRQLDQRNVAVAKITSIVSHDLRSPLAGVREVSSIMLEDEKLEPKYRSWGTIMHTSSREFLNLTNQILSFESEDADENTP